MNKVVRPSVQRSSRNWLFSFFSGTQHGIRDPCGVLYDRKKCFTPEMRKIDQAQGSLNVKESSFFFLSSLFFFYQCGL